MGKGEKCHAGSLDGEMTPTTRPGNRSSRSCLIPHKPLRRGRHAPTSKQVRITEPAFFLPHTVELPGRCPRAAGGALDGRTGISVFGGRLGVDPRAAEQIT